MSNRSLALRSLNALADAGVREVCVCPGARNAPLIHSLAQNPGAFKRYFFFEERSAAFFALGRIRKTGRPVAVLTTSGTAAGELLPAAMEAHHSGLRLILVTADRPRGYRGSGAPQATEQAGMFERFCESNLDVAGNEPVGLPVAADLAARPVHVNLCFEEPLIDPQNSDRLPISSEAPRDFGRSLVTLSSPPNASILDFLARVERPIVLVSGLEAQERAPVRRFLRDLGAPVFLESLSGLREDPSLESLRFHRIDRLLNPESGEDYLADGVVRIGGVPTLRLWRDLEDRYSKIPVLSVSRLPFTGLARPSDLLQGDLRTTFFPDRDTRRGWLLLARTASGSTGCRST